MSEKKTYKICIVGNSFSRGGSEKAHANLSNFFNSFGIEVHNIIFESKFGYDFSGKLLDIGKIEHKNSFQKLKRYKIIYDYIKKNQFNFVIDLRYRGTFYGEYILSKYVFGQTNYIPSIRGFRLYGYFTNKEFIAKRIYKKAYQIVTVSKEMEKEVRQKYKYSNVTTIYNILESEKIKTLSNENITEDLNYPFVVGLGRMDSDLIKQQNIMIKSFALSQLPKLGYKLLIIGDGIKRKDYEMLALELGISDKITFMGFKQNPYPYLKQAKFMLMTSKNEGFPNVILESMACETPVVSYDCKSGPKEIIQHKHNGLLVENQNINELVNAMNLFVEDEKLYNFCKSNTLETALQFSPENIGNQWLKLMNIKP